MTVLQSGFGSSGGYEIEKSLRFRASASAYLSRTPSVAGNRKTWTWSGWVKRGELAATRQSGTLFGATTVKVANDYLRIWFNSDSLNISNYAGFFRTTNALYRDVSAHLHVLVAVDTTQAVGADRIKLFLNGEQVTSFAVSSDPTLNQDLGINRTSEHAIGASQDTLASYSANKYFDGYLSEIHFIDGLALDPTEFGEFDAVTGVWVPKKYTGSYGTNGFYLPFNDATSLATLTADASGNGNNWTATNISLTAGATYDSMDDTPTNNFAVLNSALNPTQYAHSAPVSTAGVISNANLRTQGPTSTWSGWISTNLPATGKWYWEATLFVGTASVLGIVNPSNTTRYPNSSFAGVAVNDVLGFALDRDSGTFQWYKNGVLQATLATGLTGEWYPFTSVANGSVTEFNFGQRPFAYTPPTGFLPLCTKNTGAITPISSGSFTGNANANGPFVWLAGTPDTMTINGNAVTWGTHADRLANGFKVRTSSASYNAAGSNTFSVASFVDDFTDPNRAKANP